MADDAAHGDHRLPRTVVPHRYELTIEPDLTGGRFDGRVDAEVTVHEPVDEVALNAADLDIASAWVVDAGGGHHDATVEHDPARERITLRLAGRLDRGEAVVHVTFGGELNERLRGFYRSTWRDDEGEHVIATTQFEATDARRAFPCWDEPDLKARFATTLVVDADLLAVSNTAPEEEVDVGDGRRAVRFAETIPMSTYLVAFVVGPLEATEPVVVDGVPLRVVHVPGKGHLAGFALEVASFALTHLAGYYGIPYPGDKCDLVALPDFAFGAMENLGCITFREALLLLERDRATRAELERVADVVSHELAHMWFGDLVTMRWWNGLWLNEAFATFMETLVVDAFRPEWRRWLGFSTSRSEALHVDALHSTRPIEYPVHSPQDAEGMFDVLTYEKGGSVLRMLEQYLGEEPYRQGIARYLEVHQHGNADTTELFDDIETATGEPVRRTMDSWIFQGGHPLVLVEPTRAGVRLSQRRFLLSGEHEEGTWVVPVVLRVGAAGEQREVRALLEPGVPVDVPLDGEPEWVVANAGGHGFYRVRYEPRLLDGLLAAGVHHLDPIERYCLVDDTWAGALAGDLRAADFLDLVRRFGDEPERAVWVAIFEGLDHLHRVADAAGRRALERFVRALARPALERLGWAPAEGEDDLTRQLRGTLVAQLATLGADADVADHARRVHDQYLHEPHSVDSDLSAAATVAVAETGGPDEYEVFLGRFRRPATPQEELRYLYGLGRFADPSLFARTLEMSLDGTVRIQNAPYLLRLMLLHRERGPEAWRFVRERWDEINQRFPSNSIIRMLEGVPSLSAPGVADDIRAFFAENDVPQAARTLAQHLERLDVNVALRAREHDGIEGAAAALAG